MSSYFGTEMDVGEGAIGSELNVVIDEGAKGSDKEVGVVVELCVSGDGA